MKKYIMAAAVTLVCLTAFSFAPAIGREYAPVEKTPETTTAFIEHASEKNGRYVLTVDQIEWYEGEEAVEHFLEREADSGLDGPPDGYYIVDDEAALTELPVADDAEVLMQIYNRTGDAAEADIVWNEPISLDKFIGLLQTEDVLSALDFPYHLTVKEGIVTRIVQQYIP